MAPADAYNPTDRRPIAARSHRWSQATAGWLARRGVSPNAISVGGMVCGVAAGVSLAATGRYATGSAGERLLWIVGAVLVQLRLLANMFDGMVAVATGKASRMGELYNEAPDRVSDAATLIGLGYAAGSSPALGYVAACAALFTAYVRTLGKAAGAQNEFCGPMAKQQRMFIVTLVALHYATVPLGLRMYGPRGWWAIAPSALLVIIAGCVLTSLRRLVRIARTLRGGAGIESGGGKHAA